VNWSGISDKSIWGKVLRFPLNLLPLRTQMPIMQGKLKGKKWIVGSSTHGCWLGSYEFEKQILFSRTIMQGKIVFDLGGHVGFYTLLSSVLVGPSGKVFVFEPVPRNLFYLKEHLRLNHVNNVTVIEAAVLDKNGVASFNEGPGSSMGYLSHNGRLQVKTLVLDDLISSREIPAPDYMKIDIEGAEFLALSGAKSTLVESHPIIFLATHGETVHQQCCQFLSSYGYDLKSIDERELNKTDEILAIYNGD